METILHLAAFLALICTVSPIFGYSFKPVQYHIQTDDGSQRYFRFQTYNGQYRREKILEDGTVVGSYGWVDPNGLLRLYDYLADKNGYRIIRQKTVKIEKGNTNTIFKIQRFNQKNTASKSSLNSIKGNEIGDEISKKNTFLEKTKFSQNGHLETSHSPKLSLKTQNLINPQNRRKLMPILNSIGKQLKNENHKNNPRTPNFLRQKEIPIQNSSTKSNSFIPGIRPISNEKNHDNFTTNTENLIKKETRNEDEISKIGNNLRSLKGRDSFGGRLIDRPNQNRRRIRNRGKPINAESRNFELNSNAKVIHNVAQSNPSRRKRIRGRPISTQGASKSASIRQISQPNENEVRLRPITTQGARKPVSTGRIHRPTKAEIIIEDVEKIPGDFSINFDLGNQFHQEKILSNGSRIGRHGYVDPLGILRVTKYMSNSSGHKENRRSHWVGFRGPGDPI